MVKAIWNNKIIAESNNYEMIEVNIYFPLETLKKQFLKDSDYHTTCPFKGHTNYYYIVVDDKINKDAAWYYPKPKKGYENIKIYVTFWKGVEVKQY